MPEVKYLDLKRINTCFENEFKNAFQDFLNSGWYILGKKVEDFEKDFAQFTQTQYAIGVANGLDAIILALKALEIGKGHEVIVPSNTYIATWLAVSYVGATPIPVEPNIETYNIDVTKIEGKITDKTKAIIPVNLYGQAAELDKIHLIAQKYQLYVIEDNAQAQGAMCFNKPAGAWGDINATSFYPGKNLGALGDGGAITTNRLELYDKVKVLRNYGSQKKYYNEVLGVNSRLDELQAAFLSIKLKKLEQDNQERQELAKIYDTQLQGVGDIVLPKIAQNCTSVYHIYLIRTKKREQLQAFLNEKGIGTLIHYPIPPHLQKAYSDLGYSKNDFPIAEEIANTCLSLPLFPTMSFDEQNWVIQKIKAFYHG